MLVAQGAVRIVQDAQTLATNVCDLLADPTARTTMGASGKKAVDGNRGAVARLMQFLDPLLR
jgi:3-deoxy-D-manno-octulosonic-acid transferase